MYLYNVCMKTPIGIRVGTLCLASLTGVLTGNLNLLNRAVPVSGEADEHGNCRMSGSLITLMQTIPFTANGTISSHAVSLLLRSEQGEFELTGVESNADVGCAVQ